MTIETSKTLGGVGAILMLIAAPALIVNGILTVAFGLLGLILVLVALHDLSGVFKEGGIFSNALYGSIIGIVGAVVAAFVTFIVVLSNITSLITQLYPG